MSENFRLTRGKYVRPFHLERYKAPFGFEVQTRDEKGQLDFYDTVDEALDAAEADPSIWKISLGLSNGERVRLVRDGDRFYYENIMREVEKELKSVASSMGVDNQTVMEFTTLDTLRKGDPVCLFSEDSVKRASAWKRDGRAYLVVGFAADDYNELEKAKIVTSGILRNIPLEKNFGISVESKEHLPIYLELDGGLTTVPVAPPNWDCFLGYYDIKRDYLVIDFSRSPYCT
jgi:hypothetical protein